MTKPLALNCLNPLNPAHYLAAVGFLSLVSRFRNGAEGWSKSTLYWSEDGDEQTKALAFRPVVTLPDWDTSIQKEFFDDVLSNPSPLWLTENEMTYVTEGGSGLLRGQMRRAANSMKRQSSAHTVKSNLAPEEASRLAWLSNGQRDERDNAMPTAWMLGRKAGLMRALRDTVSKSASRVRRERLAGVLFGPAWDYGTKGPMLGLDSDVTSDGARSIRNTDGASPLRCLEALRLIGDAIPLFVPGRRGRVAAISRRAAEKALPDLAKVDRDAQAFPYPLWSPALSMLELSFVLTHPWHDWLKRKAHRSRLRTMGVWGLAAPCQKKGSVGDPSERQLGRGVRVL